MAENDDMSGLWDEDASAKPVNPYDSGVSDETAADFGDVPLDEADFEGIEEQVYEIEADIADIRSSAILRVDATDATILSSAVGVMQVRNDAEISAAGVGAILAGGDISVSRGGAQAIIAGHDISVEQGGASTIVAGGDIRMKQGGGALLVANRIEATHSYVGLMIAKEVGVSDDSRVILDQRSAMWFGAALGSVLALAFGLFFGIGRRNRGGDEY